MGVSPQRHGRGHVRRGTAKISRFPLRTGLRTHYTDCPHAALSSDLRRSRVVGTSFLSFLPDPHPMTNPHIPAGAAFRTRCSFLAALGLFALPLGAQTAPAVASATMASPDPKGDAIQLSVFEVRTDQDRGYQAANAGSGGRIDMPLNLTPAATSAFTKEFLEDWNVTDMRESFRYAMNVDPGNFTQNTSPFGEFEFNFRGVGSSGNYPTRNYFLYYGVSDSYNTERFEFSRGPNSILFGDGQIGGVATTMTKVPRLDRDAYSGTARYDSWGGLRTTLDVNRRLGKMTAARVSALYQRNTNGPAWRDRATSDEKAIDIAVAHAFSPRTKLRTELEWGRNNRLNYTTGYADQMAYYTPGYTYDRVTPNLPASQALAGITAVSTQAQNWTFIPALANLGLVNTGASQAFRSTGHGYLLQPEVRTDLIGIRTNAKLPSREFHLGANDTSARIKFQIYSAYLDHRITDSLSAQLSYYNYNNDRITRSQASVGTLQLDINRFLPNGAVNPKVGVAYGEATPNRSYQENYVHEIRSLLTWKTRLPLKGKGQFSAIFGERKERFEARGLIPARVDGPNQNWTAAENTLRYRYYVDEPGKYGSTFLPAPTAGFTYADVQSGFASIEFKDIKYAQLVAATSFFDERVSLVLGTRYDNQLNDQIGNIGASAAGTPSAIDANGLQRFGGFVPGVGVVVGAHNIGKAKPITSNVGSVVWLDKGQHAGLFYNYSQNFAPPTSGAAKIVGWNADGTTNGEGFGATTGNERAFGVRFNLLDGAISAEVRRYDGVQIDRINGSAPTGNLNAIWNNSGNSYSTNTTLTAMSFRDVEAIGAKGYEFQATTNFKGLRLITNYALPTTRSIAVRPVTQGYIENFLPIWTKWAADLRNDKGDVLTADNATQIRNNILSLQNNLAGVAPGTVNNGTNKWTGSFNANYSFSRQSKLAGWSAGWAISGRGPRKVGTMNPNILFNLPIGATATPDQNKAAAFAYLYSTAYFVQDMNASYTRRIGKHSWRFQINVANLTDKDDLLFSAYGAYRELGQATNQFTGTVNQNYTFLDPRKIAFTTSVAF